MQISEVSLNDAQSQYIDLIFYLKNGYAPTQLSYKMKRVFLLKAKHYELINDVFFRRNFISVLLRCLEKSEAEKALQELHDGPVGGHFGGNTTTHKILHAGIIGLHFSNILMNMQENAKCVKAHLEDKETQHSHYIQSI